MTPVGRRPPRMRRPQQKHHGCDLLGHGISGSWAAQESAPPGPVSAGVGAELAHEQVVKKLKCLRRPRGLLAHPR